MATELFNFTVTYSKGFYKILQASNSNLVLEFPQEQETITVDPGNASFFFIGTSSNRILLNYTLCTNLVNTTREILIDNIVALSNPQVYASPSIPIPADIVYGSRTTTGTMYTVPAGRTWMGAVSLSCSVTIAGSSTPSISVTGTGISPPTGTVLHQIIASGLTLATTANANSLPNIFVYGGTSGAAVVFTQAASGSSTGQISGRLL